MLLTLTVLTHSHSLFLVTWFSFPLCGEGIPTICDVEVEIVANLLQCDRGFLSRALTYRSIATGAGRRQSVISVPLDVSQAIFTRDALAKALYDRIFNWIVAHINTVFRVDKPEEKLSIGLLDIYGFEVFDVLHFFCFTFLNHSNPRSNTCVNGTEFHF
jgi:myosin-1